jgi:putative hydrolase of the HAD superfamily
MIPFRPSLIIFDIGNVLLRFDPDRAGRNFNRYDPGRGKDLVNALWFSRWTRAFETGRLSGPAFFDKLKRKLGLRMTYRQFCEAFNEIFTPVRENLLLLKTLSRRYRVALLSNTNPIHWKYIFKKYPLLRHAHRPYSSHILGAMKPDPRIFRALERKTGVPLSRAVYIDDREDFIRSGRRLGLTAVHFNGGRALKDQLVSLGLFSKNGAFVS